MTPASETTKIEGSCTEPKCGHDLSVHQIVQYTGQRARMCLTQHCECTIPLMDKAPVTTNFKFGFGQCVRSGCAYRSNRCIWGFCSVCCNRDHRHERAEDKSPSGEGYYGSSLNAPKPLTALQPLGFRPDKAEEKPEEPKKPVLGKVEIASAMDWGFDFGSGYNARDAAVLSDEIFTKLTLKTGG